MISNILIQAGGTSPGMANLIFLVAIIGIMYFFMIRPQLRKAKEEKKFVESIAKGDKVVTIGGIHGKIADINDTTFLLEIDKNVHVKIEKKSVSAEATKVNQPEKAKLNDSADKK